MSLSPAAGKANWIKPKWPSAKNVTAIQGDISNLADLDRLYAAVKSEKGALDVVFANAGFVEAMTLEQSTPEHFDKTFGINARGTFFTVQKALPLLRNNGSIILTASCVASMGIPMYTTYGATKAAMSLQETLNRIKAEFEARQPMEALDIMHRATDDLRRSGIMNTFLRKGDKAPEFTLPDQTGTDVSSKELLGRVPLVVSFYRGVW